ncbi:hypothetical protein GCM10020000_71360 [Streptomyces olivoverticillatus]
MTRDVAIVAFAQSDHRRRTPETSEAEMLLPVLRDVLDQAGLDPGTPGFTCSGSSDYLAGRPFSFTMALDSVGAWPPIAESHVETDGAWALYEAWVKLLTGEADTALVYACGKSSPGDLRAVLTRQLDPYYVAPLWPDPIALAALQTQALIDAGATDERALAGIAVRNRRAATANPHAQLQGSAPRRAPPRSRPPAAAAAHPRRPAHQRRSGRRRPRRRRHGTPHLPAPRLDPRHRPPHRTPRPRRARPHRLALHPAGRRARSAPSPHPSTPPNSTRPSPPRKSSCARRSGSATTSSSTPRAARSPPTPSWPRA